MVDAHETRSKRANSFFLSLLFFFFFFDENTIRDLLQDLNPFLQITYKLLTRTQFVNPRIAILGILSKSRCIQKIRFRADGKLKVEITPNLEIINFSILIITL